MPTTVVLTFDQPLDPGAAEDVRNYVILDPSGHRVRINRAVLGPTRLTVTLHPAQRISVHHPYQLTVNGAGPGAVSNMSGQPLDSVDAGQPGSSDHVVLTWRQLVLGDVSKAFRIRYGLVPKGPRAKIPSGVSSPHRGLRRDRSPECSARILEYSWPLPSPFIALAPRTKAEHRPSTAEPSS